MAQLAREAERDRHRQARLDTKLAREAERARRAYERAQAAEDRERVRLYVESRVAEVNLRNEELDESTDRLQHLLQETLSVDDFLDFGRLKETYTVPQFSAGDLGKEERIPLPSEFLPKPLSMMQRLIPGAKTKHDQEVAAARSLYEATLRARAQRERTRSELLEQAVQQHLQDVEEAKRKTLRQHAEIEEFRSDFENGKPDAVTAYFSMVLEASSYPDDFPQHFKVAYVPESGQLVVEYELPGFGAIPGIGACKYVKARDEISETIRPLKQRKEIYSSVVAQIALRTIHELFEADRSKKLDVLVFNGYVDTVDPTTGKPIKPYLVTLRTTRDVFLQLELGKVDPILCLKGLHASVSRSPAELIPVRPVLEFSMVDPRFVEEVDVLSTLDQRPNLMELTPSEFESLITNLFDKMGLETKMTRPSRDGGVDCVAYDQRPILGGKVVIQAKRYKNNVGVSAVRDLFGTVHNEGASKGILVTTSGFGKAAFEFAEGKPLELLSGTNLLYLLSEHAGIEAKIEIPEDWEDPRIDVPDNT